MAVSEMLFWWQNWRKECKITNMSKLGNGTFLTNVFENQLILEIVASSFALMDFLPFFPLLIPNPNTLPRMELQITECLLWSFSVPLWLYRTSIEFSLVDVAKMAEFRWKKLKKKKKVHSASCFSLGEGDVRTDHSKQTQCFASYFLYGPKNPQSPRPGLGGENTCQ